MGPEKTIRRNVAYSGSSVIGRRAGLSLRPPMMKNRGRW